mgnify:CR=1 FL=1
MIKIVVVSRDGQIQLLYPRPDMVEIDPFVLWEQFQDLVKEVIEG